MLCHPTRRYIRILEGAYGRLTYELTITRVIMADYGVYNCHARNTIGDGVGSVELYGTQS